MTDGHKGIWPRQGLVLIPPSLNNVGHIETQQKCHLLPHAAQVLIKIVNHPVKLFPAKK